MKVLIIGCGKIGCSAAAEFEKAGYEVSIVDKVYENFKKLPDNFHGKLNTGDALVRDVLIRARVEYADAIVLTIDDIMNLTLGRLLSQKFNCKNIIATNLEPKFAALFEEMNISTISPISWSVLRMEEMLAASNEKGSAQ